MPAGEKHRRPGADAGAGAGSCTDADTKGCTGSGAGSWADAGSDTNVGSGTCVRTDMGADTHTETGHGAPTHTHAGSLEAPLLCALELAHVSFSYDGGATWALDDVSLRLERGERLCLLGANGSGKSTLARVAAGLVAPDQGCVTILGHQCFTDERGADPQAYDAARRGQGARGHGVGMVFQSPDDQMVTTNVADDVAFGPENLCMPPDQIGDVVSRELRRVALQDLAQADPAQLSGGQQQRVAIASALALEPALLVLDEPSARLDARGRAAILRVLGRLGRHSQGPGTAVLHVTHFMDEALLADRVAVLQRGRLVALGTPAQVLQDPQTLHAEGLEPPFAARLAEALRVRGMAVDPAWDTATLLDQLERLVLQRRERGRS